MNFADLYAQETLIVNGVTRSDEPSRSVGLLYRFILKHKKVKLPLDKHSIL